VKPGSLAVQGEEKRVNSRKKREGGKGKYEPDEEKRTGVIQTQGIRANQEDTEGPIRVKKRQEQAPKGICRKTNKEDEAGSQKSPR